MSKKKNPALLEAREEIAVSADRFAGSMYSPASFYDVLHPTIGSIDRDPSEEDHAKVVAFYGFKGGAGRTTTLGYTAALIAQRGLHVIAIDLDLEAPGLSTIFGHEQDAAPLGSMHLLLQAARIPESEDLSVSNYLLPVPGVFGKPGGRLEYLPAGRLDDTYLAQLEELGVGIWHAYEPERKNPLARLLAELQRSSRPDLILLDCRTGFSSLSATALFHTSDAIVAMLPLSDQIWGGLEILLRGLAQSRKVRAGTPRMLLVPSLVLPGTEGQARLEAFKSHLREAAATHLPEVGDDDAVVAAPVEILEDGIRRRDSIWSQSSIPMPLFGGGDRDLYAELTNWVGDLVEADRDEGPSLGIERQTILAEMALGKNIGFGENLSPDEIASTLIDSRDSRAAVDRSIALVIGAKGSGKTFLWRYLALPNRPEGLDGVPSDVDYVVGLSPRADLTPELTDLTWAAFQKIEREGKLEENANHQAFWIWWTLQAIARSRVDLADALCSSKYLDAKFRKLIAGFLGSPEVGTVVPLLRRKDAILDAEAALSIADELLRENPRSVCVLFDGLDTCFQNTKKEDWVERRNRFTTGLLQLLSAWRTKLKRIQFKVFLREDIWLDVEMQNKSHLLSISHVLKFQESEMWELVLRVAGRSDRYADFARRHGLNLKAKDFQEQRKALGPLWGVHLEKGKSAYSTNYIAKRLADAKDRLFPRAVLQMLQAAISHQSDALAEGQSDRVLRFSSLRAGIDSASKQRVDDLKAEYVEMSRYLDGMQNCLPVVSRPEFLVHMRQSLKLKRGEWDLLESLVLPKLTEIGVIRVSAPEKNKDATVEVARLYREGLHLRSIRGLQ